MFKPNELERFSLAFEPQMRALEARIMADVIRRLKINGEITRAADWQLHRAYELGLSKRSITKIIQQEMGLTYKQVKTMYRRVMQLGYSRDEKLYKYKGIAQIPFEDNEGLQQLISAVAQQTCETMQNITQSLGFAVRQPDGRIGWSPIAQYYQQTMDGAMLDIASGAFDYNTVLKRIVNELTNSGLRTIDYATGHKNRVNVAARRALMTGMSQLTAKVNEDNAEQLGTDHFEIEWHGGARPDHWWGGMVVTREELYSKCGLGAVTGLCGVNCYHDYYPFIPGISERSYTDEELAKMNRRENTPVEYGGKEYTKYEATQRQRRLETTMRAQRERIALLKEGGADEQDIINARARYRLTSAEYAKFSKAMDIPQQRERVYVDGLGNIGAGKYTPAQKIPKTVAEVKAKEPEILAQSRLTYDAKRGIINEKSNKPIIAITDSAIQNVQYVGIYGYTEEQSKAIQRQHKELLKIARDKNNNFEVALVLNNNLEAGNPLFGRDNDVEFGLLNGTNLTVLHNHPRGSGFSANDLKFFCQCDQVKTLTIVKNNGQVEYITKSESFDPKILSIEYARMHKKMIKRGTIDEYDKLINKLLITSKSGVIWNE
ncbi:MAG: phage minor capsid protein [Ruminococcus sp.]|nr:phage minor capsid protein [Ruminococcus sp.]